MSTQEDVARIALSQLQARQSERELGFRAQGRRFVWLWAQRVGPRKAKVANPEVVVASVADLGEKEGLLACDPQKFFTRAKDVGDKAVLVRLPKVDNDELTELTERIELITESWRPQAPARLVQELDR
jgi:hypothetical protein